MPSGEYGCRQSHCSHASSSEKSRRKSASTYRESEARACRAFLRFPGGVILASYAGLIQSKLIQSPLEVLAKGLDRSCPGAAGSLCEGLAETITIGRLGVPPDVALHQRYGVNDRDLSRPIGQLERLTQWADRPPPDSRAGALAREETVPPRRRLSAPQSLAHRARTARVGRRHDRRHGTNEEFAA